MKIYHASYPFCGLGGNAKGVQEARGYFRGTEGKIVTLVGIDNDAAACRDFTRLTGAPAVCADMSKMTVEEIRAAHGGIAPDFIFTSPPCKGFSGLLGNARVLEEKYQALNRLVFQGLWLMLESFPEAPPKFIVLENVPRIQSRGAELLRQLKDLLSRYGYRFHEGTHDCGELGGLAQHRTRFLLIARHEKQVPTFCYKPAKQRVRAIGEVLSELPMPDDPRGGPMHTLPRLQWKTWVRLALIPAGGDWRALGRKDGTEWRGTYGVIPWDHSAGAVTGNGRPGAGKFSVADPRLNDHHNNTYRVQRFDAPSGTVTSGHAPSCGSACVADPRLPPGRYNNQFRIVRWDAPSVAVTGGGTPTSGGVCVGDPRFTFSQDAHRNKYRVGEWCAPASTVIGATRPGSGAPCIADPRIAMKGSYPGLLGVQRWDTPSPTVSGKAAVTSSNYPAAVADPRPPADNDQPDPPPVIIALDGTWHRPLTTLELAVLQDLPVIEDGQGIALDGHSHGDWRERIGNAIPRGAARAIASAILSSLLAVEAGATFVLGGTDIWVQPEAVL